MKSQIQYKMDQEEKFEFEEINMAIHGFEQFYASERREHKHSHRFSENVQQYLLFQELFIKFHLYDEKMIKLYLNKHRCINDCILDKEFCSQLNPKKGRIKFGKKTMERYYSDYQQFMNFFDRVNKQLSQLIGTKKREQTFFSLFEKNDNSKYIWGMIKLLLEQRNPLANIYEIFVNKELVVPIPIAELKQMCENLTKKFQNLCFCQYNRLFQEIQTKFEKQAFTSNSAWSMRKHYPNSLRQNEVYL